MGGACSAYEEEKRRVQGFDWENLGDLGVDGMMTLRLIFRK